MMSLNLPWAPSDYIKNNAAEMVISKDSKSTVVEKDVRWLSWTALG